MPARTHDRYGAAANRFYIDDDAKSGGGEKKGMDKSGCVGVNVVCGMAHKAPS